MIIGIDTGGTFTDFVFYDGSGWWVRKVLSTPENPAQAVAAGLADIPGAREAGVVHGSTVATNAVLEKKGAKTALITNTGFTDVLFIGRQQREALYDPAYRRRPCLVPAEFRFGVSGRVKPNGEVLEELDEKEVEALADRLAGFGVESLAVSCLFSFANPAHEQTIAAILGRLNIPVSLSHRIVPEFREYERTSTTVLNAYVAPRIRRYIGEMAAHTAGKRLRIMQSNGGSISAERAAQEPVRTILSGPAGGVAGAYAIGEAAGYSRLITFDMGGTSTDVSLVDGELPLSVESTIDEYPVNVPMLDIHTVGAGGGSIARIDAAGALKVGPESAGASPGPMCYGTGSDITVTDANLFLGRLQPDHFLGGSMELKSARLCRALEKKAEPAGLSAKGLARGILAVANTAMERAIRKITVERGFDPADFALMAYGGAGGMHAAFLARLLNIPQVIIPRNPGTLSAIGMLAADIIRDYSQTVMLDPSRVAMAHLESLYRPLIEQGKAEMAAEGMQEAAVRRDCFADMRYKGQSYEIRVAFAQDLIARFHGAHEQLYGFSDPEQPVELVNIRVRTTCRPPEKLVFPRQSPFDREVGEDRVSCHRPVTFASETAATPVIDRRRLSAGHRIRGPALIVEYSSSIVLPPWGEARVDGYGNIVMSFPR